MSLPKEVGHKSSSCNALVIVQLASVKLPKLHLHGFIPYYIVWTSMQYFVFVGLNYDTTRCSTLSDLQFKARDFFPLLWPFSVSCYLSKI